MIGPFPNNIWRQHCRPLFPPRPAPLNPIPILVGPLASLQVPCLPPREAEDGLFKVWIICASPESVLFLLGVFPRSGESLIFTAVDFPFSARRMLSIATLPDPVGIICSTMSMLFDADTFNRWFHTHSLPRKLAQLPCKFPPPMNSSSIITSTQPLVTEWIPTTVPRAPNGTPFAHRFTMRSPSSGESSDGRKISVAVVEHSR
mmetsp:Transcript_10238/g.11990  ORF Transcript_10238/g.11990 Transcript_10238/m.11990 type:complete len:203 (-) Transcript_10238:2166-2774(-)